MGLSSEIISQFVKSTNDAKKETPKEATVYGTAVKVDGKTYVKIDGSELLTPVKTTVTVKDVEDVEDGDKVTVVVGNHTATITGNMTDPAASSNVVKEQGSQIQEFETVTAYKVTTKDLEAVNAAIENLRVVTAKIQDASIINAKIESLEAKFADITYLTATDIKAITAEIETLEVEFGKFTDLSAEDFNAGKAEITNLKGYAADFTYIVADKLEAVDAEIKKLDAEKLTADQADLKYANIDFSNIGQVAMEYFYASSGLIKDVVVDGIQISGELVGVTIKGDLIEGGTVIADKLVLKGEDGLYYKLNTNGETVESEQTEYNSVNGSVISAKSITASKIDVSDLVAFDATIGGFNITENSLYSGVKASVDNTTTGVYLDNEGQVAFGDGNNFLKFFKQKGENNQITYRLAIAAESIRFGTGQDFTLDDRGMTVEGDSDDNNSRNKTNISNNGMTVYANNEEKLKANDKGVVATDLHAKTYMIVGDNSRLENYGNDRTGCFWIGN